MVVFQVGSKLPILKKRSDKNLFKILKYNTRRQRFIYDTDDNENNFIQTDI